MESRFFDLLPNACFGVVIAKGVNNFAKSPEVEALLSESIKKVQNDFLEKKVREDKRIELYREAFRKLGINPNKYLCSIEALAARVAKGGEIPKINPLVDLGNALSLKYFVPLGAHDMDKFSGDIEIRFSREGDSFVPFNATETESVAAGEVVYASGTDIKTRNWIHRQGENGKITESAKNIFFPIDGFTENKEDILCLRQELSELLTKFLSPSEVATGFVDMSEQSFIIK
ncbi:MAG: phenylalanine--tRNA ligase beta subunit-related protein [Oscillospiraceae bacterium]